MESFNNIMRFDKALKTGDDSELDPKSEAGVIDEVNEKRKFITSKIEDEIEGLIKDQIDKENDKVSIIQGEEWNSGVIGIDTDRLKERFLRPAIIISGYAGSNYVRGSVRSIPSINMYKILDNVEMKFEKEYNQPLFQTEAKTQFGNKKIHSFGGHAQACGFAMHKDNIDIFKKLVKKEVEKLPPKDFNYYYEILDTLSFHQINLDLIKVLDTFTPYGQNFDYPVFYLKGCHLIKKRVFGNKYQTSRNPHIELTICSGQDKRNSKFNFLGIGFGLAEKFAEIVEQNPHGKCDIIFSVDYFKKSARQTKKSKIQLIIQDIRKSVIK